MVASSPLLAFIAIRPDHVWLTTAVRTALKENRWAVIVHPLDADQTAASKEMLSQSGTEVLKSL